MDEQILRSSTPDGLAPMSFMALEIFTFSFAGLAIVWGLMNFLQLVRIGPEGQDGSMISSSGQTEQVREMGFKILMESLHYMKFNFIVVFGTTIVYFLMILGAVEKWVSTGSSLDYLLGMVVAFLTGIFIVITTSFSYFRIVYQAKYTGEDAFKATKTASNSITFISTGVILASIMSIIIRANPENKSSYDQINHCADTVIAFAFGYVTVTICTKITSLIYAKGIENSFEMTDQFAMQSLKKDHHHPMIICKCVGQTINKSLSKTLDFLAFIPSIVGIVMKAAGMNVIGVDQKGEIVFDLAVDNSYAPVLLIGYSLFFTMLFSIWKGSAESEAQVKMHFRINILGIFIFLSGFSALACYLTLPAEFEIFQFVQEQDKTVKSPLYAYLPCLVGMGASILISLTAEIKSSGMKYIYDLLKSCKTGAATCLISGLSKGYSYTFYPMVILAPFGFLCYFWLGILGVAMGLMGFSMFIPYYINANLYHSIMNCASMVGFVSKANQNSSSVGYLLALNESKKSYDGKIFIYYNQVSCFLAYTIMAVFAQHSKQSFSIEEPYLFSGMLVGGMVPYIFTSGIINSSFAVAPIICYDIQQQLQQNPGAVKGKSELDHHRSNHIFTINVTLRILRILPIVIFCQTQIIIPLLITGLALNVQTTLGFMGGLTISAIQLSISSSMLGILWGNVKDEIAYGRAKDEDNQDIAIDSEWGKASIVGNNVGSNIKDCSGQAAYTYILWTVVMAIVFEDLYISMHS